MIKKINYNIGGEFEFDNTFYNHNKFNKLKNIEKNFTINGISSFFQILLYLKNKHIKKIYIPNLLCESLLNPIIKANFDFEFYNVDDEYNSSCLPDENTSILIIHYYGKYNNNIAKIKKYSKKKIFIIEDASHVYLNSKFSLFSKNLIFLSLRKHGYFGPGGWSSLNYNLGKKSKTEFGYLRRNRQLRKEKNSLLKKNDYIENELYFLNKFRMLNKFFNNKISYLKYDEYFDFLTKVNFDLVVTKRINNWNLLDQILDNKFRKLNKSVSKNNVPLGFIIFTKKRNLLEKYLKKKRIFTSLHWKTNKIISNNRKMIINEKMKNSLTIPIDQRYNFKDIEYIANTLKNF